MLSAGFAVLICLVVAAVLGVRWYLAHATLARPAQLQVVSGQNLLVRSPGQTEWRLVAEEIEVREGDTITTGAATVGWLTLFDGSTVEISEETAVTISQMRASRFLSARKSFELTPLWGTIYVGMAPHGDYAASELVIEAGPAVVTMQDAPQARQAGSALVEVQRETRSGAADDSILAVRVGVLRGMVDVRSDQGRQRLAADQQTVVGANGAFGPVTPAVREMIRNGDFARGMADWVEFHHQGESGNGAVGLVQRVPAQLTTEQAVAVELARQGEGGDFGETGIQQQIGMTLRVHSSLRLSADVRVDAYEPATDAQDQPSYPLTLSLTYVDVQGQLREWWHAFTVQPGPEPAGAADRTTRLERGQWQHVVFDLRNLTPLPRQISSISIFSSGTSYRARVTNVSLSSSEAGERD